MLKNATWRWCEHTCQYRDLLADLDPCDLSPWPTWLLTLTYVTLDLKHYLLGSQMRPENHVFWPGDPDLWPMTLTFKVVLGLAHMHVLAEFHAPNCNSFWVMNYCPMNFCPVTDRRTDRHTDSGDLSPTRTCVLYVLLAIVWGHLWHHQFFIRMKNTCEPKNNCNSVTHSKNIVSLVHHGPYCALVVHIAHWWCTSTPYTIVVVHNVAWVNTNRQTDRQTDRCVHMCTGGLNKDLIIIEVYLIINMGTSHLAYAFFLTS